MAGSKRRDPFGSWGPQTQPPQAQPQAPLPQAPSPLDLIPSKAQPKRGREWEKEHRAYSYRGVPRDLQLAVAQVAESLQVTVDEVARYFILQALTDYQNGQLTIAPRLRAAKMTLFPINGWGDVRWEDAASNRAAGRRAKKSRKAEGPKAWETFAHYRLAPEEHEAVRQVAYNVTVPIGEVVTFFLSYGMHEYQAGRLELIPHPKATRMTLTGDSE